MNDAPVATPASQTGDSEIATLIAREERLRLALTAGRIYTWDWDVASDLIVWSDGLEKELQIASAPRDIRSFQSLLHPDDLNSVMERVKAALRGPDNYEAEFRMIRSDGTVRWCSARAVVVRDRAGNALRMLGVDQDVTEKHELLRRTAENEARLRFAMEAAGAGTWEYAIDRDEFVASDRALTLHGLVPGARITNHDALNAVHPADRSRVEQALHVTIETGAPFRQEIRVTRSDGSLHWLLSQAEVTVERGERRLIGLVQDITDRKVAEATLIRNQERFAVALGNSPTAVFEQDQKLRYTWIYNPKLGYAADEVIGKTDAELMDSDSALALETLKRQVIGSGASVRQEVGVTAPDHIREYFDLYVEPRRDASGRIIGVICAATDISQRKRAEEALRDSEARYRSAMALGRMASWETNYQTGVRKWTPEGLSLFGLRLIEGIGIVGGDEDEFLRALHPQDRHLYQSFRDIESGQDVFPAEYRIVRADGQTRWMAGYGRIIDRSANGRPLKMVNVATDITDLKIKEEHTQFLLRELSHRSKNNLAVVQAIVTISSRSATSAGEFAKTISSRLGALAASNDLLINNGWKAVSLRELVLRQIGAFLELPSPRVEVSGPDIALAANAVQPIALALHELTTNAAKYGALSNGEGRICISWNKKVDQEETKFHLEWKESGGPPVAPPIRKGFGQVVIKQMIEQALSAATFLDYASDGVVWSLLAPAENVVTFDC